MSKLGEIFISSRAPLSDAEFRQVRDKLEVLLAERNRARAVPVCEVSVAGTPNSTAPSANPTIQRQTCLIAFCSRKRRPNLYRRS